MHFMKCLQGPDACADRKLLVEASVGVEKAKVLKPVNIFLLLSSTLHNR